MKKSIIKKITTIILALSIATPPFYAIEYSNPYEAIEALELTFDNTPLITFQTIKNQYQLLVIKNDASGNEKLTKEAKQKLAKIKAAYQYLQQHNKEKQKGKPYQKKKEQQKVTKKQKEEIINLLKEKQKEHLKHLQQVNQAYFDEHPLIKKIIKDSSHPMYSAIVKKIKEIKEKIKDSQKQDQARKTFYNAYQEKLLEMPIATGGSLLDFYLEVRSLEEVKEMIQKNLTISEKKYNNVLIPLQKESKEALSQVESETKKWLPTTTILLEKLKQNQIGSLVLAILKDYHNTLHIINTYTMYQFGLLISQKDDYEKAVNIAKINIPQITEKLQKQYAIYQKIATNPAIQTIQENQKSRYQQVKQSLETTIQKLSISNNLAQHIKQQNKGQKNYNQKEIEKTIKKIEEHIETIKATIHDLVEEYTHQILQSSDPQKITQEKITQKIEEKITSLQNKNINYLQPIQKALQQETEFLIEQTTTLIKSKPTTNIVQEIWEQESELLLSLLKQYQELLQKTRKYNFTKVPGESNYSKKLSEGLKKFSEIHKKIEKKYAELEAKVTINRLPQTIIEEEKKNYPKESIKTNKLIKQLDPTVILDQTNYNNITNSAIQQSIQAINQQISQLPNNILGKAINQKKLLKIDNKKWKNMTESDKEDWYKKVTTPSKELKNQRDHYLQPLYQQVKATLTHLQKAYQTILITPDLPENIKSEINTTQTSYLEKILKQYKIALKKVRDQTFNTPPISKYGSKAGYVKEVKEHTDLLQEIGKKIDQKITTLTKQAKKLQQQKEQRIQKYQELVKIYPDLTIAIEGEKKGYRAEQAKIQVTIQKLQPGTELVQHIQNHINKKSPSSNEKNIQAQITTIKKTLTEIEASTQNIEGAYEKAVQNLMKKNKVTQKTIISEIKKPLIALKNGNQHYLLPIQQKIEQTIQLLTQQRGTLPLPSDPSSCKKFKKEIWEQEQEIIYELLNINSELLKKAKTYDFSQPPRKEDLTEYAIDLDSTFSPSLPAITKIQEKIIEAFEQLRKEQKKYKTPQEIISQEKNDYLKKQEEMKTTIQKLLSPLLTSIKASNNGQKTKQYIKKIKEMVKKQQEETTKQTTEYDSRKQAVIDTWSNSSDQQKQEWIKETNKPLKKLINQHDHLLLPASKELKKAHEDISQQYQQAENSDTVPAKLKQQWREKIAQAKEKAEENLLEQFIKAIEDIDPNSLFSSYELSFNHYQDKIVGHFGLQKNLEKIVQELPDTIEKELTAFNKQKIHLPPQEIISEEKGKYQKKQQEMNQTIQQELNPILQKIKNSNNTETEQYIIQIKDTIQKLQQETKKQMVTYNSSQQTIMQEWQSKSEWEKEDWLQKIRKPTKKLINQHDLLLQACKAFKTAEKKIKKEYQKIPQKPQQQWQEKIKQLKKETEKKIVEQLKKTINNLDPDGSFSTCNHSKDDYKETITGTFGLANELKKAVQNQANQVKVIILAIQSEDPSSQSYPFSNHSDNDSLGSDNFDNTSNNNSPPQLNNNTNTESRNNDHTAFELGDTASPQLDTSQSSSQNSNQDTTKQSPRSTIEKITITTIILLLVGSLSYIAYQIFIKQKKVQSHPQEDKPFLPSIKRRGLPY